jgi:hypothetical protein
MKKQKYPSSKIKAGAVLFKYEAYCYDDGTSQTECQEWVISSIMRKRGTQSMFGRKSVFAHIYHQKFVHIKQVVKGITWGKLSTKNGHFGLFKKIPSRYKDEFREGYDLPTGYYTTKLAALKYAIWNEQDSINRCTKWMSEETEQSEKDEWLVDINDSEKLLKLLKTRLKKMSK